ncbi:TPA: hypothetical protein VAS86_000656 [Streptococcus agalactiae]|nr:hypothetical protein [Streptococcus agalactiae]
MKNRKIIKSIYVVVIVLAIFKLFKFNISNYEQFYQLSNYEIASKQLNKINWQDIKGKDGIYLLTSKNCPYCLRYISNGVELVKENRELNLSENIVELDINEYFNNTRLNEILDEYGVDTIPCIVVIKNSEVSLLDFKDIQNY